MGLKRTDEPCKDAVCIALTSGHTRKLVADDLGVGMMPKLRLTLLFQATDQFTPEEDTSGGTVPLGFQKS
ncbi:hypothetical protein [Celeribacter halophilus]|uniref:hypothetical protein n=1 Tax=Celeribacter halophilus TaxID=576117 RepID=UPI003A8C8F95